MTLSSGVSRKKLRKCCNHPDLPHKSLAEEVGSAITCFGAEEIVLLAFDAIACAGVSLNKNQ